MDFPTLDAGLSDTEFITPLIYASHISVSHTDAQSHTYSVPFKLGPFLRISIDSLLSGAAAQQFAPFLHAWQAPSLHAEENIPCPFPAGVWVSQKNPCLQNPLFFGMCHSSQPDRDGLCINAAFQDLQEVFWTTEEWCLEIR